MIFSSFGTQVFRRCSFQTSNWGLKRRITFMSFKRRFLMLGTIFRRLINDTSTTTRSNTSSNVAERMSQFSLEMTRGSDRRLSWSWDVPTSTATTRAAQCCKSTCVNHPVEAPISRHVFPAISMFFSRTKSSSFTAERATNPDFLSSIISTESLSHTSCEAFCVSFLFTKISPESMQNCARFRVMENVSAMYRSSRMSAYFLMQSFASRYSRRSAQRSCLASAKSIVARRNPNLSPVSYRSPSISSP